MKEDKRSYPRANIKWPVVVESDQGKINGVTSNLTPDGLFIHCESPLRLNDVIELTIDIPNSNQTLTARAEVIWSNRYGPDDDISPRGMGVRFISISSEARKFIAQSALNYFKTKELAPELLQTLKTLVIDAKETDIRAA